MSISQLRASLALLDVPTAGLLEKSDLLSALKAAQDKHRPKSAVGHH